MNLQTAIFQLKQGSSPLLVSMPHLGTEIPLELQLQYVPRALEVEDTDWHLDQLYDFAQGLGASILKPCYSRYVIDLNRPPDNTPMYPGAANTELCPTRFFTGEALYREGYEPSEEEQNRRREIYWQPYHEALRTELDRLLGIHGQVLLWEAHSIRSHLPWLFEGKLPDLNIGTASDAAAHPAITAAVYAGAAMKIEATSDCTVAVNGRFKGGYITRHYGNPHLGTHAIQLEKCQSLYMNETAPFAYRADLANTLKPRLQTMIEAALRTLRALT